MKQTRKPVYLLFCITCVIGLVFLSACSGNSTGSTDAPSETPFVSPSIDPTPKSTPNSAGSTDAIETSLASPTSDLTPESTPILHNSDWMADYPSILQEYRLFVDNMAKGKYASVNEDGTIFDDDVFKSHDAHVDDVLSYHWFCMKFEANFWGGDSSMARDALGYALEDLNRDGIDELILLQDDYTVLAIFSTVNGKPKLLDAYWTRYECAILDSGFLHMRGDDGAGDWVHAIQRVSPDGSELLNVVQYGSRSDRQHPGEQHYYRIENGKEEEISEAELDAFLEQYPFYKGEYPDYTITPQKTTENSGITFIPLFSEQ